jgi:hypothetical protein
MITSVYPALSIAPLAGARINRISIRKAHVPQAASGDTLSAAPILVSESVHRASGVVQAAHFSVHQPFIMRS